MYRPCSSVAALAHVIPLIHARAANAILCDRLTITALPPCLLFVLKGWSLGYILAMSQPVEVRIACIWNTSIYKGLIINQKCIQVRQSYLQCCMFASNWVQGPHVSQKAAAQQRQWWQAPPCLSISGQIPVGADGLSSTYHT